MAIHTLPSSLRFSRRLRLSFGGSAGCNRVSMKPSFVTMSKQVWVWTENKAVMTAAVERGWNTFLFSSPELAQDWSSIASLHPLFVKENRVLDRQNTRVADIVVVTSPEDLQQLQQADHQQQADNFIVRFLDWQIIPAENIVAAFQGSGKTVLAVSATSSDARIFLEALEKGVGGVVLKVDEVDAVVELKDYLDRRNVSGNLTGLTTAIVTRIVHAVGMGDRVCVDLCSLMRPGEGLLVGSFARGLFLVHSECLETNYIASRPFRVNAGPVHAYVAVPGGKTCYLSELRAGKEVVVVDQMGRQRTAIVGRVKIETRPLILVEAKIDSDDDDDNTLYSILLQNAETVSLITPCQGSGQSRTSIPVTSLKVGDSVLIRVQGGARHTGIEIEEFIVEN
uniref:3-dehydroquinate synthase n=1 Tax=Kalanchoe fedtschenkoi TaxID=63787 RepID=A0A7N0VKL9_KALFE